MKIGVQLFSLRKYLTDENSYRDIFSKVKDMGAEVVQISATGAKGIDSKVLSSLSCDYDLPICITHAPFSRIRHDLDKLCIEHQDFNCNNIGIGMMPKEFRTGKIDDINRFVDILNETAQKLKAYNMNISYHNHWFEFDKIGSDIIYDYMIENTDKSVYFIPDTYWIKFKGGDIIGYMNKLLGRINTLHLKDYKKTLGIPLFRAVGKGILDFETILSVASKNEIPSAVVELDLSPNPLKSIKFSLEYLNKLR
jgi:sugar phosphate isomerase/epimerase